MAAHELARRERQSKKSSLWPTTASIASSFDAKCARITKTLIQHRQRDFLLLLLFFLDVRFERLTLLVEALHFLQKSLHHVDFLDVADWHAFLEDNSLP